MSYSKRQMKIWSAIVEEYEDLVVKVMYTEKATAKDLARALVVKQLYKAIPKKAIKMISGEE